MTTIRYTWPTDEAAPPAPAQAPCASVFVEADRDRPREYCAVCVHRIAPRVCCLAYDELDQCDAGRDGYYRHASKGES